MSRLFLTDRELAFFSDVTKEMLKDVIGQTIQYFSINEEKTKAHDVYNEAKQKFVYHPVEIEALVLWSDTVVTTTNFNVDVTYNIEVYFHKQDLDDRKIIPQIGDFVQFGDAFFELTKISQPDLIGGQPEHRTMYKCSAIKARYGQFDFQIIERQDPFEQVKGTEAYDKRRLQVLTEGSIAPPMKSPFEDGWNDY